MILDTVTIENNNLGLGVFPALPNLIRPPPYLDDFGILVQFRNVIFSS